MLNIKELERIENIYNKFEELRLESSSKAKEVIIYNYKDDKDFDYTLSFLLDKHKKTGIAVKKLDKELDAEPLYTYNTLEELLEYIIENNTGTDDIISSVQNFINNIDKPELRVFISELITKKYKPGVTSSTASKYLSLLKPPFKVMKGYALEDPIKQIKQREFIVTLKLDGYRISIINRGNGIVEMYTTEGHLLEDVVDIEKEFINMPIGVYDGEMIAVGEFEDSTKAFQATSTILRTKGAKQNIMFHCFDYVSDIKAWESFTPILMPCIKRKEEAKSILMNYNSDMDCYENKYKYISYVNPMYIGKDTSEIYKFFDAALILGEEGVIVNIANAPHERKKSTNMFKVKPIITLDLNVIDFIEGTGKDTGRLGSFIVDYKGYRVGVAGISDEVKEEVWSNKEFYLNKLIEIEAFGESVNSDGSLSIRLPRFKRFRHDKTEVSYS